MKFREVDDGSTTRRSRPFEQGHEARFDASAPRRLFDQQRPAPVG
jgi:hypothetical protein